jgi:hypothetical protein
MDAPVIETKCTTANASPVTPTDRVAKLSVAGILIPMVSTCGDLGDDGILAGKSWIVDMQRTQRSVFISVNP